MSESKKVIFDKKALSSANKKKLTVRTSEVEVPELNEMMGLKEGEVTTIVVRQMHFDELIEMQQGQFNYMRNLVEGIVEASASKEAVKEEATLALDKKNPVTAQRLEIITTCILKPKLSYTDIVYIAKMFPSVPSRLYTIIINLTDKGADLKKNSTD